MECPPQRVVQTSDVCFGWRRVEARRVQAVERGAERAGDPISTKRSVCVWKKRILMIVCGVVTVNCVKAVYICCPWCVWPVPAT